MSGTAVQCTLDLDRRGAAHGWIELPRSHNTSAWSKLVLPIVSIRGGEGPTALVIGGVHGDEPEGQVASLNLARLTRVEDVLGQLIVVPCASPEASRAHTRLWPSGANFNRSFPGSPEGSPEAVLADFFSRYLFPRADVVVDMHSGGRTAHCLVWSEMHLVDDPVQRNAMTQAMLAWNTDYHFVYIDIAGGGLLVGEAERQGKLVVSTELGGGGHVTARTHRIAFEGLRNVLRHTGVLAGTPTTREQAGLAPPVILRATEPENYVAAPESGYWETFVDLGDEVTAGQALGQLHFLERPDRPPSEVVSACDGVVCTVRAIAPTEQGDNVAVVARAVALDELQ